MAEQDRLFIQKHKEATDLMDATCEGYQLHIADPHDPLSYVNVLEYLNMEGSFGPWQEDD